MKKFIGFISVIFSLSVLTLGSAGCALSTHDKAVISTNEVRQIALSQGKMIDDYCVPKYKEAKTAEDIKKADEICLPARTSYQAVKGSWENLVTALSDEQRAKSSEQQVEDAIWKLFDSLKEFKKNVERMK